MHHNYYHARWLITYLFPRSEGFYYYNISPNLPTSTIVANILVYMYARTYKSSVAQHFISTQQHAVYELHLHSASSTAPSP